MLGEWNANFIVKDDFLDKEHFDLIKNIHFETRDKEWEIYKHKIFLDESIEVGYRSKNKMSNNMKNYSLSNTDILNIHKRYHLEMIQYLEELSKEKISLYKFTELNVVSNGKKYEFPIHNDSVDKLLSAVIFIEPEKNEGTFLYSDKEGSNPKQIDWKPNRAFIFSRNEQTWHSYKSDGISNRKALVYNLRG